MTEFLDLRRERAGPAFLEARVDDGGGASGRRDQEAVPLDGRIALRIFVIEQMTILDIEQRIGDQGWDRRVIAVSARRMKSRMQRRAGAVEQGQPSCARLLAIEGKAAGGDKVVEFGARTAPAGRRRNGGRPARR